MKNKLLLLILLIGISSLLYGKKTVNVIVLSDDGTPVQDAEVMLWFDNVTPLTGRKGKEVNKLTDQNGLVQASGSSNMGVSLRVEKEGYYGHGTHLALRDKFGSNEPVEEIDKAVTLRRTLNPTPLYAKSASASVGRYRGYLVIPEANKWFGYDFEQGDWLKPHGTGKKADILFRYEKEFIEYRESSAATLDERREMNRKKFERQGWHWDEEIFKQEVGRWDGLLEISFPGEKEGIATVEEAFNMHSVLRMPHQAPKDGYAANHSYSIHYEDLPSNIRREVGYFLRTRVILDQQCNIESANYTKIYGDIGFNPAVGGISFTYYYNPIANDRNLEFDPKQNLFPSSVPGSRVLLP